MERRIFAGYRLPWSDRRAYEFDHHVPRCLGGLDTAANLWPQPLEEAIRKDALEHRLCRAACTTHTMTAPAVQAIFLGNWRAYLR